MSERDTSVLLEQIANYTRLARTTWLSLLAFCAFCWITLLSVNDRDILLNTNTVKLPILDIEIQPAGFLIIAPLVALALHMYLQVAIVSIWKYCAYLPPRTDGFVRRDRIHPWIAQCC